VADITTNTADVDGAAVADGDTVAYTVSGLNDNTQAADVTITDQLPAGLDFIADSVTYTGGTATQSGPSANNTYTWVFTGVAAGASVSVTFDATVNYSEMTSDSIDNTAYVNNKATNTTTIHEPGNKAVSAIYDGNSGANTIATSDTVHTGDSIAYEVSAINFTSQPVDISISDGAPVGTSYKLNTATVIADGGASTSACDDTMQPITWSFSDVPAGATVTVQFQAVVTATTGYATNQASLTIGGNTYATNTTNNPVSARYTVSYDANGGSGAVPTDNTLYDSGTYVQPQTSPVPTPPSGYQFAGWSTSPSGNPIPGFNIYGDTTLYAIYTLIPAPPAPTYYHVTYNANGGTGMVPVDNTNYASGSTVSVAASPIPSRIGFTFVGWGLSPNSQATLQSFTITQNTTLYAVWTSTTTVIGVTTTPPSVAPTVQVPPTTTTITPGGVPLGNATDEGGWSLLSMIMSIIALLGAIALIITAVIRRRKDKKDDNNDKDDDNARSQDWQYNMHAQAGSLEQTGQFDMPSSKYGSQYDYDDERIAKRARRSLVFRIAATIMGILVPIIWLILDDLNTPMVWINKWTIVVAIAFIIFLILWIIFMLTRHNKKVTVTYNQEGGYGIQGATESGRYGETLDAPLTNPAKDGCIFIGWNTVESPTVNVPGILWQFGDNGTPLSEANGVDTDNNELILYAQYDSVTHSMPENMQ
jgi:fimbrial isopeptide formation D2 family protein/uncharacterized repeat protein (TIGR02543 family)